MALLLLLRVKRGLRSLHSLDQFLDPINRWLIGDSRRHDTIMVDLLFDLNAPLAHGLPQGESMTARGQITKSNPSGSRGAANSESPIKKNQAGIAPRPTYTARGLHPTVLPSWCHIVTAIAGVKRRWDHQHRPSVHRHVEFPVVAPVAAQQQHFCFCTETAHFYLHQPGRALSFAYRAGGTFINNQFSNPEAAVR
jgi:hypothetical protein